MLDTHENNEEDFFISFIPTREIADCPRKQIKTPPTVIIYAGKGCSACSLCTKCAYIGSIVTLAVAAAVASLKN